MWIHGSLRMQECRDESEIYNCQQTQLSNKKKFIDQWNFGGYTWPGLTVITVNDNNNNNNNVVLF